LPDARATSLVTYSFSNVANTCSFAVCYASLCNATLTTLSADCVQS